MTTQSSNATTTTEKPKMGYYDYLKPKSDEQKPKPTCESGTDLRPVVAVSEYALEPKYRTALEELRICHRMWRTGEQTQIGLCNDVDRILKTVDQ